MEKAIFDGMAAGVSFDPAKKNIKKLFNGDFFDLELTLVHMPENKYDKNAIRLVTTVGSRTLEVGWVPKAVNTKVLEYGLENVYCMFSGYNMYEEEAVGFSIVLVYVK